MASDEYLILRHENTRYRDILSHLVFRRKLTCAKFVEHNCAVPGIHNVTVNLVVALTLLLQKLLAAVSTPLRWLGYLLEFFLNFYTLNDGFFGIPWRIFTVSLEIPKRKDANFRSIIGHIDGRYDLLGDIPLTNEIPAVLEPLAGLKVNPLVLSMMAAKLSYENEAYIQNEVVNRWKMHFVRFHNGDNKYLMSRATQAFIFCDKAEDANLIVVAFRGTEAFNALDWITDVDLSWLCLGKLGMAHLGFMRALGLQDEKDCHKGFPKEVPSELGQRLTYYAIREELRSLLAKHWNAKIVITGHSLGGALAILFPAILALHEEQHILDRVYRVMTYGQPRVGDPEFGTYMQGILGSRYHRMVYRFDVVPRVPWDAQPIAFKHFGTCIYFVGWYQGQVVDESPDPNFFDPMYTFSMHFSALVDLLKAVVLRFRRSKDFQESYVCLLYRTVGLVLPGVAFHSPRDYLNGGKLARIEAKASQKLRDA